MNIVNKKFMLCNFSFHQKGRNVHNDLFGAVKLLYDVLKLLIVFNPERHVLKSSLVHLLFHVFVCYLSFILLVLHLEYSCPI